MNAWLPAAPCTPAACVDAPVLRAAALRRWLRWLGAVAVVLAGVVLARVAPGTRMTVFWSRLLLRSLGIRLIVRQGFAVYGGAATARAVPEATAGLLVANHLSWLDPLVMAASLPCRIVAKREVAGWPLVGGLAAGSRALLIDRDSLYGLPDAVAAIAAALREGESVAAFPEGTTWCGKGGGRFRPAVFQAALDARVPVRPVALRYRESGRSSTAPAYVGDDSLVASLRRVIEVRGLIAEVTVLPPVTAPDRKRLAWIAEAAVASVTGQPTAKHPPLRSEERVPVQL
ncbi:lysophospholipid acyltransferase family protein [Nonomuraea sp. NPDC050556]|uniref:lysophospholipid acyltransferase family protein n=1 Tax=Nonomuraea sp. NPDC050556 TaxID=3364369 RepID=UPI00379E1DA1